MNSTQELNWLTIVNLHAGSKRCERDWPEIKNLLEKAHLKTEVIFTTKAKEAIEITQKRIDEKGFKNIIVVGGDGTMNEVVNGIFRQKRFKTTEITIGLITVGTGNDWGRHYGMHSEYHKMVNSIKNGKTFIQDVGKVNYKHLENKEDRYFVNIAGMGYDALVAKKTNVSKQSGRGGLLVYLVNLIQGLFQYNNTFLTITANVEDPSGYIQPRFVWDFKANMQLTVGGNAYFGSSETEFGGVDIINTPLLKLTDEAGDSLFIWLTMFF